MEKIDFENFFAWLFSAAEEYQSGVIC